MEINRLQNIRVLYNTHLVVLRIVVHQVQAVRNPSPLAVVSCTIVSPIHAVLV